MSYWLATLGVFVFSYLTGFSIGRFVFTLGLAMLVLGPFRHRSWIFWPPMAAVLAFLAGYLAVGPMYCTSTTSVVGTSTTSTASCDSLFGIVTYPGTNPPLLPGVVAGSALAVLTWLVVASVIWLRGRSEPTSAA